MAQTNGHKIEYDPSFTPAVIAATGPNCSPRLREVMTSLIQHVHDFAREVNLTTDEYMAGVQLLNWAGQMSTDRRNEGQLVTDVIGLESLVDEITYKNASKHAGGATASAILGPFWRETPEREWGSSVVDKVPDDGKVAYVYGRITDAATGEPLKNALVDIWQASTNGLYEQQDPDQPDHNLRGKFRTNENGDYAFYCLRPTPYPVLADGYKSITTQVFDSETEYLDNDSVFAVKDGLTVKFTPRKGDEKAPFELKYDIQMAPLNSDGAGSVPRASGGLSS